MTTPRSQGAGSRKGKAAARARSFGWALSCLLINFGLFMVGIFLAMRRPHNFDYHVLLFPYAPTAAAYVCAAIIWHTMLVLNDTGGLGSKLFAVFMILANLAFASITCGIS